MLRKLFGIALTIAFFVLSIMYVYQTTKDNWYQQGFNTGHTSARHEIITALKKDFSEVSSQEEHKVIFTLKTTAVVIYKRSDIKTIGIVE